jgi:hypothetical protein
MNSHSATRSVFRARAVVERGVGVELGFLGAESELIGITGRAFSWTNSLSSPVLPIVVTFEHFEELVP